MKLKGISDRGMKRIAQDIAQGHDYDFEREAAALYDVIANAAVDWLRTSFYTDSDIDAVCDALEINKLLDDIKLESKD